MDASTVDRATTDAARFSIIRIHADESRRIIATCTGFEMARSVAQAMTEKHPDRRFVVEQVALVEPPHPHRFLD